MGHDPRGSRDNGPTGGRPNADGPHSTGNGNGKELYTKGKTHTKLGGGEKCLGTGRGALP